MPVNRSLLRIIDANANRLKEALRVCEDISRFALDESCLSFKFKNLRHGTFLVLKKIASSQELLDVRDTQGDVGKKTSLAEKKRKDLKEVFFANIKRAQESLRVLEETTKLLKPNFSSKFKRYRYSIYKIEKESASKF